MAETARIRMRIGVRLPIFPNAMVAIGYAKGVDQADSWLRSANDLRLAIHGFGRSDIANRIVCEVAD